MYRLTVIRDDSAPQYTELSGYEAESLADTAFNAAMANPKTVVAMVDDGPDFGPGPRRFYYRHMKSMTKGK